LLLSEAARYIKSNVSIASVIRLYGYEPDSKGFMRCPFHHDPTPSLKLYDTGSRRGWYCFGCHAGGSVIDFVMKHDDCSFAMAVKAIDHHLNLGLLSVEDWLGMEHYHRSQRLLDQAEKLLLEAADQLAFLLESKYEKRFQLWLELSRKQFESLSADEVTRLLLLPEDLQYLEYRLSRVEDFRKEVREWRSSQRLRNPNPR